MRFFDLRTLSILLATVATAVTADRAIACSVCFGDPNSPLVQGARAGILALAGLVYLVLIAIAAVAGVWTVRARRLAAADSKRPAQG